MCGREKRYLLFRIILLHIINTDNQQGSMKVHNSLFLVRSIDQYINLLVKTAYKHQTDTRK